MSIDWTDACQRAAALRNAYFGLLNGDREALIRNQTGLSETEVRYTSATLPDLRREMMRAEDECRAKQGLQPVNRRFALTAGSRRHC